MTMMLLRRACEDDLTAIHQLAIKSGVGITTLPKDSELLQKRLAWATASFNKPVNAPSNEYYLFVLEDPKNGKVVGTSAIEAATGYDTPFYSYKLSKHTQICHELNIRNDYNVLSLVNDYQGQSELCTLFLEPSYRLKSNGALLSRSRFLFIAQNPERFSPTIIAEMRGVCDEEGRSPFWDQVDFHFFHISFAEADRFTLSTNKQFIADLMPRHPIHIQLLSPTAQAVIGKPHPLTEPAMKILLKEGFRYNNYVDIFDAGPTIEARQDQIHTIATSKLATVKHIHDDVKSKQFIVANTSPDYRATVSHVVYNEHQHSCVLNHDTAELLQIKPGEHVRISPLGISK